MTLSLLFNSTSRLGPGFITRLRHDPRFEDPAFEDAALATYLGDAVLKALPCGNNTHYTFDPEAARKQQVAAWVLTRCNDGDALFERGDLEGAWQKYSQAIDMESQDIRSRLGRAEVSFARSRCAAAIDDLLIARQILLPGHELLPRVTALESQIEQQTGVPVACTAGRSINGGQRSDEQRDKDSPEREPGEPTESEGARQATYESPSQVQPSKRSRWDIS